MTRIAPSSCRRALFLAAVCVAVVGCDQRSSPIGDADEEPNLFAYEIAVDGDAGVELDMRVLWLDDAGRLHERVEQVTPPWWHRVPLGTGIRADFEETAEPRGTIGAEYSVELRIE